MIRRKQLTFVVLFLAILAPFMVTKVSADNMEISISLLTDERDHCYKYVREDKYLKITHSRILYVDPATRKIVGNAFCAFRKNSKTSCQLLGNDRGDVYVMISVTLKAAHASVDVDYRYNDDIMKLSEIDDPRTVINQGFGPSAISHLQVTSITVNKKTQKSGSCHDNMPKILLADHGLYITKMSGPILWENIYFEPYGLGEYIFEK